MELDFTKLIGPNFDTVELLEVDKTHVRFSSEIVDGTRKIVEIGVDQYGLYFTEEEA